MGEAADEPTVADLAHGIEAADRPSAPVERRLRMPWNVPFGTTPYIPLWFALAFVGLIVGAVVVGIVF